MPQKISFLPFSLDPMGTLLSRPAANMPPAATPLKLFTVAGGRVLLTMIIGEVTTVIQTQANATKLTFDPDAAGATQDLCAGLDITADAVGTIYTISGLATDAMRDNLNYGRGGLLTSPLILKPGGIFLVCAATTTTGQTKWDAWYQQLDPGAFMLVA